MQCFISATQAIHRLTITDLGWIGSLGPLPLHPSDPLFTLVGDLFWIDNATIRPLHTLPLTHEATGRQLCWIWPMRMLVRDGERTGTCVILFAVRTPSGYGVEGKKEEEEVFVLTAADDRNLTAERLQKAYERDLEPPGMWTTGHENYECHELKGGTPLTTRFVSGADKWSSQSTQVQLAWHHLSGPLACSARRPLAMPRYCWAARLLTADNEPVLMCHNGRACLLVGPSGLFQGPAGVSDLLRANTWQLRWCGASILCDNLTADEDAEIIVVDSDGEDEQQHATSITSFAIPGESDRISSSAEQTVTRITSHDLTISRKRSVGSSGRSDEASKRSRVVHDDETSPLPGFFPNPGAIDRRQWSMAGDAVPSSRKKSRDMEFHLSNIADLGRFRETLPRLLPFRNLVRLLVVLDAEEPIAEDAIQVVLAHCQRPRRQQFAAAVAIVTETRLALHLQEPVGFDAPRVVDTFLGKNTGVGLVDLTVLMEMWDHDGARRWCRLLQELPPGRFPAHVALRFPGQPPRSVPLLTEDLNPLLTEDLPLDDQQQIEESFDQVRALVTTVQKSLNGPLPRRPSSLLMRREPMAYGSAPPPALGNAAHSPCPLEIDIPIASPFPRATEVWKIVRKEGNRKEVILIRLCTPQAAWVRDLMHWLTEGTPRPSRCRLLPGQRFSVYALGAELRMLSIQELDQVSGLFPHLWDMDRWRTPQSLFRFPVVLPEHQVQIDWVWGLNATGDPDDPACILFQLSTAGMNMETDSGPRTFVLAADDLKPERLVNLDDLFGASLEIRVLGAEAHNWRNSDTVYEFQIVNQRPQLRRQTIFGNIDPQQQQAMRGTTPRRRLSLSLSTDAEVWRLRVQSTSGRRLLACCKTNGERWVYASFDAAGKDPASLLFPEAF